MPFSRAGGWKSHLNKQTLLISVRKMEINQILAGEIWFVTCASD